MIGRLKRYAETVRDSLRYEGLAILSWRILVKLLSPVAQVDHQILFDMDLTQTIAERPARVDCTIEPATEADIERIVDGRIPLLPVVNDSELSDSQEYARAVLERERAELRQRFAGKALSWLRGGEMCFVARIGSTIAHSNWIQFHGSETAGERPIHLMPGEVYMTEGFTAERWRGNGIHEAVNSTMLRYAKSHGCKRAYTITDLTKARARRGVIRVGWRWRGHHLFISSRWLGRTWIVPLAGDTEPVLRDSVLQAGSSAESAEGESQR
ncbi:MAG: hypothetical protein ABI724_09990 [Betaproteobacteria bacterium]